MNQIPKIVNSDHLLVERIRKGDEVAFRKLMEEHKDQVLATVLGMLGSSTEAYDISQEVFINFYKSIAKFRNEATVGTYLTRIAINLSLNELKRRQRKNKRFGIFGTKEQMQIEDNSQNPNHQDNKQLVNKGLQLLEKDLRTVVVLRMIEGYSTKETAHILEIPEGTVLSRLARGRDKLRTIINQLEKI